ncbi:Fe-S cluster assembly protein SufD [Pseudorhodoplanes sinuspersici]|uniref:Fe-S cluster assembly protein SufD n=1 Tax=Pseudorhodoplanes sinuspersici TaxID=1235591 RepID=A0A1W7A0P9_9HYPH|nr:Fe-S cluster assembly protein SufD [Pseudorhodoplanes sinuspersici]ARQ03182.1 Fe-S cluster assembly protein SufD [Pseudorhodoplanes sinuspersici]RKE73764.1 iron-regulated ABC transporter permease protein SufD [Pseudorhodoplanes sinuspersici]
MAELTLIRSAAEEAILSRFPDFNATQSWGGVPVARQRQQAFETLKAKGLPTRRVEDWKYTDLRAFMRDLPPIADAPSRAEVEAAAQQATPLDLVNAHRVLFVNGRDVSTGKTEGFNWYRLANGDALPPTVTQALNSGRSYADNAAVALNTAFMNDVTILHVPAGTKLERPLHLIFRNTGHVAQASFARVLVVVEAGASVALIETHDGPEGVAYQSNTLVEIDAGDGAKIDHIRNNNAGNAALGLSTLGAQVGRDARLSSFSMNVGGAMSRHQIFIALNGKGSELALQGASLLRGRQHADTTMEIDHVVGHCTGRELFKSVLDNESRSVFQGKIIVRPDAQKTDGKMASHALLLSEDAEADHKPELEIFADDVVCGHGATAGALDEDLLFYLRARGIPQKEAEALMIEAFVGETVEAVSHEALREALMTQTRDWLASRT